MSADLAVIDEPMWTLAQLAEYLQIPEKTIRNWRVSGAGPRGFRVGRHVRFRRADVMEWLEQTG